ncbi:hypothetical protein AHMF7605_19070 [Adhaeribacter arboris]|uniref:STAS/SEC14 domain-containing protein n=1 Tax=Adhaeribacter arboris TaxID=2072846 RepID=A0A2T2YIX3_9BACT|nr:hypothetical protein [Adhaeribacter arboris]PSR55457.1 hypothetical protein AHMF7605_19070 [Adhaeribacter arboris]
MRCLSESFLLIDWDEEYDIIYLEWHYYPGSEKYRESLELAINLARQKNIKYGIANVQQITKIQPDDLSWLIDAWIPGLLALPIKKVAVILPPEDFEELVAVYLNRLNISVLPFEVEFFDQTYQAYNWVKNGLYPGPSLHA